MNITIQPLKINYRESLTIQCITMSADIRFNISNYTLFTPIPYRLIPITTQIWFQCMYTISNNMYTFDNSTSC